MRQVAMVNSGDWEDSFSPLSESAWICGCTAKQTRYSGFCAKVERASLLPGGQTHGAGYLSDGSGNTSSPEPVIGYSAAKGLELYYRAVLLWENSQARPRMNQK